MPAPKVSTYDASKLIIDFGVLVLDAFRKGDFLTISKTANNFSSNLGLHGAVVPIMSKDRRGTANITVMRESGNNASLSIIAALDQLSGLGNFPFLVTHPDFSYLYSSVQSRVIREPDITLSRKNGYMTWVFELYNLIRLG